MHVANVDWRRKRANNRPYFGSNGRIKGWISQYKIEKAIDKTEFFLGR